MHRTGSSTAGSGSRAPVEQVSARHASISHARALLIYVKHRGVLNVEEFRRTKARSQTNRGRNAGSA